MVKIRITGLPDDIESFLSYIREHFFISKESKAYKDSNSKFSRKYVEVTNKSNENDKCS